MTSLAQLSKNISQSLRKSSSQSRSREDPFQKKRSFWTPTHTWDHLWYVLYHTLGVLTGPFSYSEKVCLKRMTEKEKRGVFSCVLNTGSGFWSTRGHFWCVSHQMKQEGNGTSHTFYRFPTGPTGVWSWWRGSRWHHRMNQHAGSRDRLWKILKHQNKQRREL